jgi:chlorobactene glucosyltransferase
VLALGTELALVAAALAVLVLQGVALLFAAQMPRLDPHPPASEAASGPSVSVVVAARDEEEDLPANLESVRAQDYPNLDVVVVEGGSTDRTAEVIDRYAPRVRRVPEEPLPTGWVGKNWACATGARATRGEWLLFLDADVVLHPAAVRTAIEWARSERADLVTLAPQIEMVGFWGRTVMPFYVQMILTIYRAPRVNRDRARAAMINGQFWLTPRREYEALGGHEAVRGKVLEDVAIARRYRAAGRRLRIAWAPALARTRMYRDRREMAEGLLKNLHGTDYSVARQVAFAAGLVGLFWLPLGLLPLGLLTATPAISVLGGLVTLALFGKHVALARAVGAPARYGLLYPVAVGFYVALLGVSIGRGVRGGGVTWKGRTYPLRR